MAIRWYSTVVDCADAVAQADWWAQVLDWRKVYEDEVEVILVPPHALTDAEQMKREWRGPGLFFVKVPDGKRGKNRLHLDLAPWGEGDLEVELQRLLDLGATRADIGQQGTPWVVLADPEGNEFCLLPPRDR